MHTRGGGILPVYDLQQILFIFSYQHLLDSAPASPFPSLCLLTMSHPYQDDYRHHPGASYRPYPPRDNGDGRMYDDRSRSRSPGGTRSSPHGKTGI